MALFVAVNAKYIHSSLAVRYLRNVAGDGAEIFECSINDNVRTVSEDIFKTGHKHILFSCYLWNIEMVLKICEILKKADDTITITLGGPEVSYNSERFSDNPYIDHIICGEGETQIAEFLSKSQPRGVYDFGIVEDFDSVKFPYKDGELQALKDRLIYYETSRGCPYGCAFCLSSAVKGVRFRSAELVESEILKFIQNDVKLVKLVDRTFNADNKRALRIVEFIKKHSQKTSFHFEVKAESMSDELIDSLASSPNGMFQLEIGVQSTDPHTLERINRKENFKKLSEVVKKLQKNNNIHLHLDLIAGLPGEDLKTFVKSFNDVFSLRPHDLQLGFLKKLHGSKISENDGVFSEFPPYEIVKTDLMSYNDIVMLKDISACVERVYNSASFQKTVEYLAGEYETAFDMFFDLAQHIDFKKAISRKNLYEALYDFSLKRFGDERLKPCLTYDFCLENRDYLSFMEKDDELRSIAIEFMNNEALIEKYFPEYINVKPTDRYKKIRLVRIDNKIYAFDASAKKAQSL